MNIISLIDENISSIVDYYDLSKILYEEVINYMNAYKIHTSQYSQKISNLQKEYENKITSLKGKYDTNIYNEHLFEYVNIFPNIIKKQLSNYDPLFTTLELFIKDFCELMNKKIILIKTYQDQYTESKKAFLSKYQEIENSKTSLFNNLSLTEDAITQFYTQKKFVDNEDIIYNQKSDSSIIHLDKNKKLEEKMNNLIKETKMMEKNYNTIIESSKQIKQKVKKNSEETENIIQLSLNEISQKFHNDLKNIMTILKIGYQEPLNILNNYLNKICQVDIKKELEELYKNFANKNVTSANIFPSKYKLKTIGLINSNASNIFSLSMLDQDNDDDLENINNEKEEISEINFLVIKKMYNNFTLLSANKIDIKSEEEKLQTKKLSNKLFLNIKNCNNTRTINTPPDKLFSQKDFEDLEKLIDKIENRYLFLQRLTRFRALKYDFSLRHFIVIGKLLNEILSKFEQDNDYFTAKNCLILSQTFYYKYQNEKIYLKAYIQNNKIFKTQKFWEMLLDNLIKENEANSNGNHKDNIFGNVYTLINNMFDFGLNEQEIKEIIEPKIKLYNLDDNHLKDIDELFKLKSENETYIEENKKYEKYIGEIVEKYNEEIAEEMKNKEKNDNKINSSNDKNVEEKNNNKNNNKFNKSYTYNKNINNNKKVATKINKSKKQQSIWELDDS